MPLKRRNSISNVDVLMLCKIYVLIVTNNVNIRSISIKFVELLGSKN